MELILASNSPRRKEILKKWGYNFSVIVSGFNEGNDIVDPIDMTVEYAFGKAKDVFEKLEDKQNKVVLGADTVVFFKGKILGKPKSEQEAFEMLKGLSGSWHKVVTGYALISKDKIVKGYVQTEVLFNELSEQFILDYIKTGSPMDKAGGYGIQDEFPLVKTIRGSLNNVIGLPVEKISVELKEF